MAIVILGGLVTSTLLNLFVVPSLYLRFGARRQSEKPIAGDLQQPAFAQP
jgi:Cu/Ag efflux pump CusA